MISSVFTAKRESLENKMGCFILIEKESIRTLFNVATYTTLNQSHTEL